MNREMNVFRPTGESQGVWPKWIDNLLLLLLIGACGRSSGLKRSDAGLDVEREGDVVYRSTPFAVP